MNKQHAAGFLVLYFVLLCTGCAVSRRRSKPEAAEFKSEFVSWKESYPFECSDSNWIDSTTYDLYSPDMIYRSIHQNYTLHYYFRRPIYDHQDSTKLIYTEKEYGDSLTCMLFDSKLDTIADISITRNDLQLENEDNRKYFLYDLEIIMFNELRREAIIQIKASFDEIDSELERKFVFLISKKSKTIMTSFSTYSANNFCKSPQNDMLSFGNIIYHKHKGIVFNVQKNKLNIERSLIAKIYPISDSIILISSSETRIKKQNIIPRGTLYMYKIDNGVVDSIDYEGSAYGMGYYDSGVLLNQTIFYYNPTDISNILFIKIINNKFTKVKMPLSLLTSQVRDGSVDHLIVYDFTIDMLTGPTNLSDPSRTLYPTLVLGEKDGELKFCRCFYRKEWITPPIKKSLDRLP